LQSVEGKCEQQGDAAHPHRIHPHALGEPVNGLTDPNARASPMGLDALSTKGGFFRNVGPAMLRDSDDPRAMRLLARALSTLPRIEGNAVLAGEDGIHWKVIRESAALLRYVTDHSPGSIGSFNFTGTAMLQPYAPSYPGAYHTGAGKQLSIGLEGASVVQEVFSARRGDFDGALAELTRQLTLHAKVAESIGHRVATSSGWNFMGVDPTPAPLGD